MKKLFILAAVAAVAMTGCSNENGNNGAVSGNEITMRAIVDKNATRASAMTFDRLGSFHAIAFHDEVVSTDPTRTYLNTGVWYDSNEMKWTYSPKAYLPSSGTLSFYAYSPIGDRNMTGLTFNGGVTFDYTVPHDQYTEVAEDLLVSSVPIAGADVAFPFVHALSAATFSAVNLNYENQELVYVITDITIDALDTSGTYDYSTWSNQMDSRSYVAPLPKSGVAVEPIGHNNPVTSDDYKPLLTDNDFLIVMPQNNVSANVIVTFNLRDGSGSCIADGVTHSFPLNSFNFAMSTRYDFQFKLDALEAITMDVVPFLGWGESHTGI